MRVDDPFIVEKVRSLCLVTGLIRQTPIAQEYIQNPLLEDGYKLTFRFYVVLTSLDPIKVYVYREGVVRVCTEKY